MNWLANKLFSKNTALFVVFLASTLFLYRNTHQAGLVFDFNGWAEIYNKSTFWDAFHCFGYTGLHQVEQLTFYSAYQLFGFNGTLWYLLFCFLHAWAALTAYWLLRVLLKQHPHAASMALFSSLLFLVSPLAADVVVSKVTIHYLLSAIFMFSCLRFYLLYDNETGRKTHLLWSLFFYILALFSLEIAYAVPIAVLFISLTKSRFSIKLSTFITPGIFVFVLLAFLLLHKALIGTFIGHYGAETHTKFDIAQLVSNSFGYFAAYLTFFDAYPYHIKMKLLALVYQYAYFIVVVAGLVLIWFFHTKKYLESNYLGFVKLLGLAFIFLLPILNLFLSINANENDRYGYFSSLFIYAALSYALFQVFKVKIAPILLFIFSVATLTYSYISVRDYEKAGELSAALIENYAFNNTGKTFILVQPENVNGVRLFTSLTDNLSEFSLSLFLERGIDIREQTQLVYEMNMTSVQDSVKVTQVSPTHFSVEIGQWGTWFWKHHNGATSFETDDFYTVVKNNGLAFDIHFKRELSKNDKLIYVNGKRWEQVVF